MLNVGEVEGYVKYDSFLKPYDHLVYGRRFGRETVVGIGTGHRNASVHLDVVL